MTDEPTPSDPREVGRLAAFHYRDFRRFWISLFVSNIGTWMQMTATNWLLYQLTDSPVQLGLNGIFRAIPAIGFGLISGTLADRYDRRRLMLWTQLLLGLLALGLGILDHSGHVQAWQIYAFTFVSSTVVSFAGAARRPPECGGAEFFIMERRSASRTDSGWRRHQPHGHRRSVLRECGKFRGCRHRAFAHANFGIGAP